MRKEIHYGYELRKKNILYSLISSYLHMSLLFLRQFLEALCNDILEISFPVLGHCIKGLQLLPAKHTLYLYLLTELLLVKTVHVY